MRQRQGGTGGHQASLSSSMKRTNIEEEKVENQS